MMHIKKIISQHRRDFQAEYQCEHCDHVQTGRGYDDANYHANVIPRIQCKSCGKTASEDYRPLTTKYAEGVQV